MADYPTPKAIVLTPAGVFYDTGRTHPVSGALNLGNLRHVLAGAESAFRQTGGGVMIVDTPMPTPDNVPELDGWTFTTIKAWTTFVSADAVIPLGFLPDVMKTPGPLLHGHQGPADIAYRLGRYQELVGVPWRYTAGVSASAYVRDRYTDPRPGAQPLWRHEGPKGIRGAGPLIWRAAELPDRADPRPVAMFDINAMFLAALGNARLAWGALQHTGPCAFDPSWPGYWEIDAADIPAELIDGKTRPPIIRAQRVSRGAVWLTTPTAKYLADLVGSITVVDSWTSANGQTVLRPFADRLKQVRAGQWGHVGKLDTAIKRSYSELVGLMARAGGSIYRPDWSNAVADLARANFMRRLDRAFDLTGIRPFEVRTDAAYFLIKPDEIDGMPAWLGTALGVGTGPGTFKKPVLSTVAEHEAKRMVRG